MFIGLLDFFCSRPFAEPPKMRTRIIVALSTLFWGVLTFIVGFCLCGDFALPGENALLLSVFTGASPSSEVAYPGLRALIDLFLGASPSMLGLNLFGAAMAGVMLMLTWLATFFWVRDAMTDDSIVGTASWVGQLTAHLVCLLFLFSLPGLYATTAFTHHVWVFTLALLCLVLQNAYAINGGKVWRMALFALVLGASFIESPWVVFLAPIFLLRTLAIEWRLWDHSVRNLPIWFIMIVVGATLATLGCASRLDGTWIESLQAMRFEIPRAYFQYLRDFFAGSAWLINFGGAILLPALGWATARRLLNNERSLPILITSIVLTAASIILLFGLEKTPIHTWLQGGIVPVGTTWFTALSLGMLILGWAVQLFAKNPNIYEELDRRHTPKAVTALRVGALLFFPLGLIAAGAILACHVMRFMQIDRAMTDRFALEIVNCIKPDSGTPIEGHPFVLGRAWIDKHLALTAYAKKVPITIFSPDRAQDPIYLKDLKHRLEHDPILGDADRLRLTHLLDYNLLVFIQDFFTAQPNIAQIAVAFDMPDIWYASKLTPLRPALCNVVYRGIATDESGDMTATVEAFEALQKRWETVLAKEDLPWWDLNVTTHRSIRHHLAVCANNLGTLLDDQGSIALNTAVRLNEERRAAEAQQKTEDVKALTASFNDAAKTAHTLLTQAATCYYAATEINSENISALLNLYDISVRRGYLKEKRELVNKKFNDFIAMREREPRKLNLNAVGRVYGYIRNYELFVQMGWGWAVNAAPESVLAGLRNAQSGLIPSDPRNAQIQSVVASIYELQGQTQRSFESYRVAISHNPKNVEALRGLARLSIQQGNLRDAGQYLAEAEAAGADKSALDLDRAAYCMAIGDLEGATKAIGNYTTSHKDSAIGWAMLGMLEIEKGKKENLDAAAGYILQNIKRTARESGDLYFQHILEGRLMHIHALQEEAKSHDTVNIASVEARKEAAKRALELWEEARKQYRRAYALKPNVRGLLEIILDFDRRLRDKDGAEADAFAILRDDPKHPFANFIVGSQRLEDGEVNAAINYFRLAVDGMEMPPIDLLNNYVDALSRTDELPLAREMGMRAITQAPDNYAAWGSYALALARAGDVAEAKNILARTHEIINEAAKNESTRFIPDPRLAYVDIWIAIAEKHRIVAEKKTAELKANLDGQMTPLDKKDFADIDLAIQQLTR